MKKVKSIYLLPNLLTTANFFCGIWAITLIFKDMYFHAALVLLLAMLFDFMDGHVARMSKTITSFGTEYDSLSDLVSFGIAPGLLVYQLMLSDMGRIGLGIFFIYTVSVALRLARFNSKLETSEKTSFSGLPCPAAAGVIASSVISGIKYECEQLLIVLPFIMVLLAYFMVSNFRYQKLTQFIWKKDFLHLVLIILAVAAFLFHAELCILVMFVSYSLSGVITELLKKIYPEKFMKKSHSTLEPVERKQTYSLSQKKTKRVNRRKMSEDR